MEPNSCPLDSFAWSFMHPSETHLSGPSWDSLSVPSFTLKVSYCPGSSHSIVYVKFMSSSCFTERDTNLKSLCWFEGTSMTELLRIISNIQLESQSLRSGSLGGMPRRRPVRLEPLPHTASQPSFLGENTRKIQKRSEKAPEKGHRGRS